MHVPPALLHSLQGLPGFRSDPFEAIHTSPEAITSIRLNPNKLPDLSDGLSYLGLSGDTVPWCRSGFYLEQRPSFTFDPLFHAGCYYVQEASSMFLEQAIRQLSSPAVPLRVLDCCAAPGGKSTHLLSLLPPGSLLVSNEVIRSRSSILEDNLIKWGGAHAVVTQNDPADMARLGPFFDIILVDAPCSGSGLFRKDPEAAGEWSEQAVIHCSRRQQRILADVLPALRPGGLLVYSTCSYSREENEAITERLMTSNQLTCLPLSVPAEWQVVDTGYGYRFWPDRLRGEGFFMSCFRAAGTLDFEPEQRSRRSLSKPDSNERKIAGEWVRGDGWELIAHRDSVHAIPESGIGPLSLLADKLRVLNAGIRLGSLRHDKLIPDHSLALSGYASESVRCTELDKEDAIRYLQCRSPQKTIDTRGWQLATYRGHALGWMNVLAGRINNYYPRALRILKDAPDKA